jgi:flagellar M-ring protein FliF
MLGRVKTATSALSTAQIATLILTFAGVVALMVGSAYWVNTPTWAVLFSDMDAESAGGVVAKLKNDKVPYTIDDGGRTIRVPATRVDELRLSFAGNAMPASGRIGFEIFDRTAFGVTDFLEHVNYRRALEGELARTISTIGDVSSARVHIAMPRPSIFAGQDQAAKASVVLKLKSNRPLGAATITAISGLVAASVEGLRPDSVVIMDTFGRPLARAPEGSDEASGGVQLERQQRIEHDLSTRVVALLEPIVGAERVRVNISAKINADSQEETEERWDPSPVMRSRQATNQAGATLNAAGGVAGARANMPPDPKPADPKSAAQTALASTAPVPPGPVPMPATNSSEITNYEVGRLTRHRIQPHGQVARLSVAVLLDDDRVQGKDAKGKATRVAKPRNPEELQKIHDIVAAAVGLDADRGDSLTVENIAFEEPPADEAPALEPWWKRQAPQIQTPQLFDAGRIVSVLLIATLVVFGVLRPMMKRTLGAVPSQALAVAAAGPAGVKMPKTVAEMETEIEAELLIEEGGSLTSKRLPVLTKRVAKLTKDEPENAARLVRTWLSEEER